MWGWVKKGKACRNTNWQLQNSHGDVKYSIENIVNNIVITVCGARGVLDLSGEHFISYIKVESLCCTPDTNIILYINCN